jgi:hypothetical protein
MDMQRRILVSMLCLSLASLAPMPLSACAMLMALPTECAPALADKAPQVSHCEHTMVSGTQADENAATLQANTSQLPCCQLTSAPSPDASAGAAKVKVVPANAPLTNAPQANTTKIFDRAAARAEHQQFTSPPDRQPLLCTFLI